MITQKENETRQEYLIRVTIDFIRSNGLVAEQTVDYDETTCDGYCLADDLENEFLH